MSSAADGLASPRSSGPLQVLLNVYDVAQGDSKGTVVRLNNLVGPKGLGLGGVFHGAVVLGTVEFSFGFCEQGTGVYAVKAGQNPMYTFRETIDLGPTHKSMSEIRSIIQQLKQEWPGSSYDLLYRNCCHFCVDLAARLEVGPVPGWLNRFASGAAATINMTHDTVKTVQEFGAEVGRFWNRTVAAASQQQQQLTERLQQQQQSWRDSNNHHTNNNHHHQQQQQQQRAVGGIGVDGSANSGSVHNSGVNPSGDSSSSSSSSPKRGGLAVPSQLAVGASQAGQQLWSGLTQAGQQLRASTSRLASQAAAAAKAGSSSSSSGAGGLQGRFASLALGSRSLQGAQGAQGPMAGYQQGVEEPLVSAQQQQQQGGGAGGGSVSGLLGAQPKLSKEYRLSAGGTQQQYGSRGGGSSGGGNRQPFAAAAAAAVAAAAAGASSGGGSAAGGGRQLRQQQTGVISENEEGLMPFLSVDDADDPFVALVGEDDAPDDAQQKAAVECAVLHSPAAAAAAAVTPPVLS